MNPIRTYNVEAGLPTLDDARRSVIAEIKRAKREGVKVLKVIHGYGSSGKGGALCVGLRKSFGLRKKEGVIRDFIAGEDFSIFNDPTLSQFFSQKNCRKTGRELLLESRGRRPPKSRTIYGGDIARNPPQIQAATP